MPIGHVRNRTLGINKGDDPTVVHDGIEPEHESFLEVDEWNKGSFTTISRDFITQNTFKILYGIKVQLKETTHDKTSHDADDSWFLDILHTGRAT